MDNEAGTFANRALHFDAAAVRLDNRLDKTQTQPETALRAALVASIEALPDVRQMLWRDAGSGVADRHDRGVSVTRDTQMH